MLFRSMRSRMKIPMFFAYDVVHGHRTVFPISLGLASSWDMGVVEKAARISGLEAAADKEAFERKWAEAEVERQKNYRNRALVEAYEAMLDVGLPCIIRPSFTLGGTGGGIAYTREEFFDIVEKGLDASPTAEVLIEESVLGWKEYEMEVVRDKADN